MFQTLVLLGAGYLSHKLAQVLILPRPGEGETKKEAGEEEEEAGEDEAREKKTLQPLPHARRWFTVVNEGEDIITCDDSHTPRAKMTCGHILTPESMADYCRSILQANKHIIQCPAYNCQSEWPYFVVRHISSFALGASELEEFDQILSERYLNRNIGIQKCPKCCTYIMKDTTIKTNNVLCQICSKNGKKEYFCWLCLQPWLSDTKSNTCGNLNCSNVDKRIPILQDCPNKVILDRNAPSIRGCPKCGLLLEYKELCSQICCKGCNYYFCFFCLKGAPSKAQLTCNPYKSSCRIAPRQTILPGM